MNSRFSRFETIAYLLAFLLAFGLRFARLGAPALTDSEATVALQALHLAQGLRPALSPNVAYVNLTAILFFIFGSTNFLARFWPALVGSALPLVPWLFRGRIKPRPAIFLAFFLAVDPALVAISRTAGGSIFVVAGLLFAWGFWERKQPRLAGIFSALALLGGSVLWAGLLGLLITWLITQGIFARPKVEPAEPTTEDSASESEFPPQKTNRWALTEDHRSFFISLLATLFVVSTLFLLAPQGLSAWLGSPVAYLRGWFSPGTAPASRLLLALAAYEPLAIVLAMIALVRGWINGSQRVIRLSLWMLVALLLALFYPQRQPVDLVWPLIPLWAMASLELARHARLVRDDRLETVGVILFTILLLGFAWLDFIALYWLPIPSKEADLRLALLLGSVVLFIVSIVLVGYGWSGRVARIGAAWGVLFIFGIYTLGSAWGATGLRMANSVELYRTDVPIGQAQLLVQTADQMSDWSVGQADQLPVTIFGVDSPALLWALRFHNPQVVTALDPTSSPAMVITPPQQNLQLAAAYRGQDFSWRQTPSWDVFSAYSLRWLTLRELPSQPENIVLWVRNDLFKDAQK